MVALANKMAHSASMQSNKQNITKSYSSNQLSGNSSMKKSPTKKPFWQYATGAAANTDERLSCQVSFTVKAIKIVDRVPDLDGLHCVEIQRGPLKS